ncbi:MAG TPA: SMP-30/gluconolactonase/LRE family protein [Mucilaginibacter sp.]|nr:SMP-30/gluconolactonase/LRE family protein [Mucilaginibacter sp.]
MKAELLYQAGAKLGEGALWNHDTQKLYWVDIEDRTFNILDPNSKENKAYSTVKRVGTVVPAGAGFVLVALEDGIAAIDLSDGTIEYKLETDFHLEFDRRFNDGKCDPNGYFWVGTHSMSGKRGESSLYRISPDLKIEEKISGVSISNGIVWTEDKNLMYYIDTPTGQIVQYDFGQDSEISNKKIAIEIPRDMGDPDGMAIDREGKLWVALWDGFCVVRCDPETGEIIQKIEVPAPKVTSCTFGGPDMDILYITTASVEMTYEDMQRYPLSGGIFSVKPGVKGVFANKFNL